MREEKIMGRFIDFEKMKEALEEEHPQGIKKEDFIKFCKRYNDISDNKKIEFMLYIHDKGIKFLK